MYVPSLEMSGAERAVARVLAFGPMRQAGLCDSCGYSINTVKSSLRQLERAGLVAKTPTRVRGRYEYRLRDNPLARHLRDTYLREYEILSSRKARRSPGAMLEAIDQIFATLRTVRGRRS